MICARSTLACRQQDGALWIYRPAWRLLVDAATSSGHAPERESECVCIVQIPLLRLVVDLLYNLLCTTSCTTNLQQIEVVEFEITAQPSLWPLSTESRRR